MINLLSKKLIFRFLYFDNFKIYSCEIKIKINKHNNYDKDDFFYQK